MKILLLEDDVDLSHLIEAELCRNGFLVDCCYDGEEGMLYALREDFAYDVAIIDRMLPIIDGLTIVKAMRNKNIQIPILITTGMSLLEERVEGLDGGADDYLVKPFHIQELLARIRAVTRRPMELKPIEKLVYADILFDYTNRTLFCNKHHVLLTAKEAEVLVVLIQHATILCSKELLLSKVWGTSADVEIGNVDTYISFLRKRLKEIKSCCEIRTVYGAGYRLEISYAT